MTRVECVVILLLASMALAETATAEFEFGPPVSDGLVIQRETAVPVWGTAEPGARVVLTFAGKSHRRTADSEGRWRIDLPAREVGGPYGLKIETGRRSRRRVERGRAGTGRRPLRLGRQPRGRQSLQLRGLAGVAFSDR